jgi:uncharacterized peroxidase-related enzyme
MSFISVIGPDSAAGKLARIYSRVSSPDGQVDNVMQVHSLRPHSLEGHMALYKSVLHHSGNQLPKWFLEAIGVVVSRLNGCTYCVRHHSEGLRRLLRDNGDLFEAYMAEMQAEKPGEPFERSEVSALIYTRKLTLDPGAIEEADISAMKTSGLSDGQILEVNQVASYFAYANRTVSGLGVNTEGEILGLSPGDSADPGNWSHD